MPGTETIANNGNNKNNYARHGHWYFRKRVRFLLLGNAGELLHQLINKNNKGVAWLL